VGLPFIASVAERDIRGSDAGYAYLTALKEILQYAGVSRCDMEKGEMRCDANVSVREAGAAKFGTRVEIKNLNSFKNVKDAIDFEFRRQVAAVEAGERIVQETRLWNVESLATSPMRSKEEAHDYRYFPDPDLVPLTADPAWVERLKSRLPELPAALRARLISDFGLSSYEAEVLVSRQEVSESFLKTMKLLAPADAKTLANLMLNIPEFSPIAPNLMASIVSLTRSTISINRAKELFTEVRESGKDPKALVEEKGLAQVSDESQIREWVREALAANPKAVEDLRGGKDRAIGSIVGTVMKLSRGKANPGVVNRLIKEAVQK
jgi:aspartyl-tRNA(Asn)/glutamyl-tRNA(Gln) amidotransferase subunit B